MAEALNCLYKAELVKPHGLFKDLQDVEIATARWVHWYNTARPHWAISMQTPVEHEAAWALQAPTTDTDAGAGLAESAPPDPGHRQPALAGTRQTSPHKTRGLTLPRARPRHQPAHHHRHLPPTLRQHPEMASNR